MITGKIQVPLRFEIETSKGRCMVDGNFFFGVDLDFFASEELGEITHAMKDNIIRLSTQTVNSLEIQEES